MSREESRIGFKRAVPVARRGSTKALSVEQEDKIAALYGGRRSKSSGAADHDQGDVRCPRLLIECKMTKTKPPRWIKDFEKITHEAYSEGRDPAMAFRFYDPESVLADREGYIDLVVRRAAEDALREKDYAEAG
jgi:hypothetical protein